MVTGRQNVLPWCSTVAQPVRGKPRHRCAGCGTVRSVSAFYRHLSNCPSALAMLPADLRHRYSPAGPSSGDSSSSSSEEPSDHDSDELGRRDSQADADNYGMDAHNRGGAGESCVLSTARCQSQRPVSVFLSSSTICELHSYCVAIWVL